MKHVWIKLCLLAGVAACGATNVKLAPIKVEPIHLTVDVNLHESSQDAARPKQP